MFRVNLYNNVTKFLILELKMDLSIKLLRKTLKGYGKALKKQIKFAQNLRRKCNKVLLLVLLVLNFDEYLKKFNS